MEKHAVLRVHACEVNAQDFEALRGIYAPRATVIKDGQWHGEGPEAVCRVFREECACGGEVVERVADLDGDVVLVNWRGGEGKARPHSLVRCRYEDGLLSEVRIDHDPRLLSRVAEGPEPFLRRMRRVQQPDQGAPNAALLV